VRETHVYEKVHLGKKEGRLFRIVKTTFILGMFVKGGETKQPEPFGWNWDCLAMAAITENTEL